MRELVAMSSPDLDESDFAAVRKVLESGRLALGPAAEEFERQMAAYVGVRYAVAVSSGTAGLHLVVRSLGIGQGDEVLVPSFTFAASVNAILYERAIPVFVDIEPRSYNLDPDDLERKVTPRTKAVMAVDVFGHPADWSAIGRVSSKYGLKVIDDSCEALGAEYRGQKLGSFGNAAVFAFYPNKQLTSGEGGMIITDDATLAELCRSQRNQGRSVMGGWLEHERLGWNYRLDEMSAALGLSQFRRLAELLRRRETVAARYTRELSKLECIETPEVSEHVKMSWFVYVVKLPEDVERGPVMKKMEQMGIPTRAYFTPVHLQPYVRRILGTEQGDLPVTEAIARRTLALPFHNHLSEADVRTVVGSLEATVQTERAAGRLATRGGGPRGRVVSSVRPYTGSGDEVDAEPSSGSRDDTEDPATPRPSGRKTGAGADGVAGRQR